MLGHLILGRLTAQAHSIWRPFSSFFFSPSSSTQSFSFSCYEDGRAEGGRAAGQPSILISRVFRGWFRRPWRDSNALRLRCAAWIGLDGTRPVWRHTSNADFTIRVGFVFLVQSSPPSNPNALALGDTNCPQRHWAPAHGIADFGGRF
jgi:hypothetical protein